MNIRYCVKGRFCCFLDIPWKVAWAFSASPQVMAQDMSLRANLPRLPSPALEKRQWRAMEHQAAADSWWFCDMRVSVFVQMSCVL